jgi:hypothetical protein
MRSIPTLASSSNCKRSKEIETRESKKDTETDTKLGTPLELGLTGGNLPTAR